MNVLVHVEELVLTHVLELAQVVVAIVVQKHVEELVLELVLELAQVDVQEIVVLNAPIHVV